MLCGLFRRFFVGRKVEKLDVGILLLNVSDENNRWNKTQLAAARAERLW